MNIDRLFTPNYIPTYQDMIHTRIGTVGAHETSYERNGLSYRIFDVGGSRIGRRKWRLIVEDVDVVFFQAPLGAYDKCIYEDDSVVSVSVLW